MNDFTGKNVLILGGSRGIWRTIDGGLSWTNISNGIGVSPATIDLEMRPGFPNTLLAVVNGSGVWRTTDADALTPSWALLGGLPTTNLGRGDLAVSPADPNVMVVSFSNSTTRGLLGVYRTEDDGANWANQRSAFNSSAVGAGSGWAVAL